MSSDQRDVKRIKYL